MGQRDRRVATALCEVMPDNTECTGCARADGTEAVVDQTEACFTFAAPVTPTGVCQSGKKICKTTADKMALEWGTCAGECSTAGHGITCGLCGGSVMCDGQCSVGTPQNIGNVCNLCGSGTIQCNCPAGTQPVYCGIGWEAGFSGRSVQ